MEDLFCKQSESKTYNELSKNIGDVVDVSCEVIDGKLDTIVPVCGGAPMRALYVFSPQCKNEVLLTGMMRTVRTHWYAMLSNLLFSKSDGRGKLCLEQPFSFVPPLVLKPGKNGKIYLLQVILQPWIEEKPSLSIVFNIINPAKSRWGNFEGVPFLLDWQAKDTHSALYGFGGNVMSVALYPYFDNNVSYLQWEYQRKHGSETVMPTSFLYQDWVRDSGYLRYQMEALHKLAQANSTKAEQEKNKQENIEKKKNQMLEGEVDQGGVQDQCACCNKTSARQKLFKIIPDDGRAGAALFVQAIATLEMIIKDPQADIVVRRDNQEDFVAALKLLEQVVIPQYFFKVCSVPLFKNYELIKPVA